MEVAMWAMDEEQTAREKEVAVDTCCSAHIARASLAHIPSHRSTQLCVLGMGLNLDGVAARIVFEKVRTHGADHIFAIVLPDRVDRRLIGALAKSVHYQLTKLLDTAPECGSVPLHVLKEGTSTRERCQAFCTGGLVVATSRILCADLLHRRVAPEVIAVCLLVFPSIGVARAGSFQLTTGTGVLGGFTNLAFCVEILLRGREFRGTSSAAAAAAALPVPTLILLSDNPLWMNYLVSRHRTGKERFMSLLHVGDIQLYPRFRLNVVEHFEKLAKTKPLTVDRTLVSVSQSTQILDDLLKKILLEVLTELQSLQRRLGFSGSPNVTAQADSRYARDEDADLRRLQPRVRASFETAADGQSHRIQYEGQQRRGPPPGKEVGERRKNGEASTCTWRDPFDARHILFDGIRDTDAQETETAELDMDLALALDAGGPTCPFKALTESLLDVRRLRRAVRYGSQYDFIFILQHVLEKRVPRLRPGSLGPPPRTAALWTLSSHFGDVVTVATHRIGRVEELPEVARYEARRDEPIGIDVDSDDSEGGEDNGDDEVVLEVGRGGLPAWTRSGTAATSTTSARKLKVLIPSAEEQDNHYHLAHRLALAWVRDQRRKLTRQAAAATAAHTATAGEEVGCVPTLLLVVFGLEQVRDVMRRLRYSADEFRRRQLASFLARYQMRYGIAMVGSHPDVDADVAPTRSTVTRKKKAAAVTPAKEDDAADGEADGDGDGAVDEEDEADSEESDDGGDFFDAEAALEERAEDGNESSRERPRATQPLPRDSACAGGSGLALHDLLLSQAQHHLSAAPPVAVAAAGAEEPRGGRPSTEECLWLEYCSGPIAVLRANCENPTDTNAQGSTPLRIVVVDGATLRPGDLLSMVRSEHRLFRELSAAEPGEETEQTDTEENPATPRPPPQRMAVRRIILTQQNTTLLREVEVLQDELEPALLRRLKVQLVVTTFSEAEGRTTIEKEKAAFQALAGAKATLTGRLLMDRSSVRRTEELLEAGLTMQSRSAGRAGAGGRRVKIALIAGQFVGGVEAKYPDPPVIIFDEREFRSLLPFYLYTHGMDLVPLTLNTADYVLSPQYAVERKSVPDFFQSITGHARIHEQLTALASRYEFPMLLIEFDRGRPFRLVPSNTSSTYSAPGSAYRGTGAAAGIYQRLARLVVAHPRVSVLWARSPVHSAGMLTTLKLTAAEKNVDPSDVSLTGGVYAGAGEVEEGGAESEATKAVRRYAVRVLARFPGVTATNADAIMRLCGSLAGLAQISKDSLIAAIGAEDGGTLFGFLHAPLGAQPRHA